MHGGDRKRHSTTDAGSGSYHFAVGSKNRLSSGMLREAREKDDDAD